MDETKKTKNELLRDLLHQCTDESDLEIGRGNTAAERSEAAPRVPLHKRSDEDIAASVVGGPMAPLVLQRQREVVLIARESQKWVRTNAEGKEILDRCNRVNTVREIADELTQIYDIPYEVALASCINVIRGGLATGYLWDAGHKTTLDLWLHVTDACNMRCPFCFRGDPEPSTTHPEMTVEGWSRTLDSLGALPAMKVTISGGEPTLFPDLERLLDVLNSKPNVAAIFLLTNGIGASAETYKRLATKVSTLQVSLDGARPETNDLIRGPGNFARVTALLRELQEAKVRNSMLAFTATRLNCQDMYRMIYLAEKYETGGLHVNRLTPMGRALTRLAEIDITAEEFRKEVHATVRHYQIMLGVRNKFSVVGEKTPPFALDLAYGAINNLARPRGRTTCGLGNSLMSISAYGDVSPCSALAVPDFVFGNVQDESLQTIHSRMATEMRKLSVHSVPGCAGCEVQQLCAGGCRARAYHLSGDITAKDPLCDREGILDLLFQIGPVEYVPHEISSQLSEAGVLSIGDDGLAALAGARHDAPSRPAKDADVCLPKTDAPADE